MTCVRNYLVLLLMFGLAGCATYEIPEGTPTAMIRFTAGYHMTNVSPSCPEDKKLVKVGLINNEYWNEKSPVKMYGTHEGEYNKVLERLIPAGRTVAFSMSSGQTASVNMMHQCSLIFEFTPTPGAQYQADYQWIGDKCGVMLSRLSMVNGAIKKTRVSAKLYEWTLDHTCK